MQPVIIYYRLIAFAPSTPATAEATAMTTFRIMSQRERFIAITLHTSFPSTLIGYLLPENLLADL